MSGPDTLLNGQHFVELHRHIYIDGAASCGVSVADQVKDNLRLELGFKTRGLAFYTLDLPRLDSLLLDALERGRLDEEKRSEIPFARGVSGAIRIPRFLRGFWKLILKADGTLRDDACPTAIFFLRQIFCLGKKLEIPCTEDRVEDAVREWKRIEQQISSPVLHWAEDQLWPSDEALPSLSFQEKRWAPDDAPLLGECHSLTSSDIGMLRSLDIVTRILTLQFPYLDILSMDPDSGEISCKHGPGAVSDLEGAGFKYRFPHWPSKLQGVFPYDWFGTHDLMESSTMPSSHEPPSRLIGVPKTAKAPRLIAAEPVAHQWCQQGVSRWLVKAFQGSLTSRFVDINDQMPSQHMVRAASVTRDLATIDLSSASDRMSCSHVESVFRHRRDILSAFHAVRTRYVRDDISNGDLLFLKKFAAMGSALTFPVQSFFFLCVALASCGATSKAEITALAGRVRVYGDDIIVPVDSYRSTIRLLELLGLKVNTEKSFSNGYFRESCGLDCFKGYTVTPVKPKKLDLDTPTGVQSAVDLSNNLQKAGCWFAAERIRSQLAKRGYTFSVHGPGSASSLGLFSFCGATVEGLPFRWNDNLHRWEVQVHSVTVEVDWCPWDGREALLQYFTEKPQPDLFWRSGRASKPRTRMRKRWVSLNEAGVDYVGP